MSPSPEVTVYGTQSESPTRSVIGSVSTPSGLCSHADLSRNSGNRSFGVNVRLLFFFFIVSASLLVCVQSGDGSPDGAFLQERDDVVHQCQFLLAAFAPAETQRLHEIGELFAVEDHTVEDGVPKALQRLVRQAVLVGDCGAFGGVALVLDALVAVAA